MIIKGHDFHQDTILEVGKFTVLWNWFEYFWCNNDCNSAKIKDVANRVYIDPEKQCKLANTLNLRRNLFDQLTIDYVEKSLHPYNSRLSKSEDLKIMRQFMEQTGEELPRGCLLILYRIRNNLMHGLKLFEELDEQLDLFCAATAVLESIEGENDWSE